MGDGVTQDMTDEITQATAATLAASLAAVADGKKVSQRTASYTVEEDKMLYAACIEISQDPLFLLGPRGQVLP
jgi:hypothetical protein